MTLSAHAYVIRGTADSISVLEALLEKEGIQTTGNPDFLVRTYSHFTIDDARDLRERAALHGLGGAGRIFVIVAPTIPVEAQNALLKTFEEPPAGARFFIIVQAPEMLLPTLRSRMQTLEVPVKNNDLAHPIDASVFLTAAPQKRLDLLKPLLEKDEDDKRDMAGALALLHDLERLLAGTIEKNPDGLRAVYRARKYITDRGALTKALLEQVALLMPVTQK